MAQLSSKVVLSWDRLCDERIFSTGLRRERIFPCFIGSDNATNCSEMEHANY